MIILKIDLRYAWRLLLLFYQVDDVRCVWLHPSKLGNDVGSVDLDRMITWFFCRPQVPLEASHLSRKLTDLALLTLHAQLSNILQVHKYDKLPENVLLLITLGCFQGLKQLVFLCISVKFHEISICCDTPRSHFNPPRLNWLFLLEPAMRVIALICLGPKCLLCAMCM